MASYQNVFGPIEVIKLYLLLSSSINNVKLIEIYLHYMIDCVKIQSHLFVFKFGLRSFLLGLGSDVLSPNHGSCCFKYLSC